MELQCIRKSERQNALACLTRCAMAADLQCYDEHRMCVLYGTCSTDQASWHCRDDSQGVFPGS